MITDSRPGVVGRRYPDQFRDRRFRRCLFEFGLVPGTAEMYVNKVARTTESCATRMLDLATTVASTRPTRTRTAQNPTLAMADVFLRQVLLDQFGDNPVIDVQPCSAKSHGHGGALLITVRRRYAAGPIDHRDGLRCQIAGGIEPIGPSSRTAGSGSNVRAVISDVEVIGRGSLTIGYGG